MRKSITLAELADHPLIIPSRPHSIRMSVENALAGIDRKIRVAHEIECIPAVIDLVRQGHGFAVLPFNAVRSTPWGGEVRSSPSCARPQDFAVALRPRRSGRRVRCMRRAIDVIRDIVRREIRSPETHA